MYALHSGAFEKVDAVAEAVKVVEHHTPYTSLDDKLRAFKARRCSDIEGLTFARVVAAGNLGDCVGLSMKHIRFGYAVGILAHILEACRRAVEAI